MKSGGPWNLRGPRTEVREAARAAARRCGQSVGEWLNSVIEVVDEEDGEYARAAGFDRFPDDGSRQIVGSDDWRHRETHLDDREANAQLRQHSRADDPEYDRRCRHADQDDRETNGHRRQHSRAEDPEQIADTATPTGTTAKRMTIAASTPGPRILSTIADAATPTGMTAKRMIIRGPALPDRGS